MSPEAGDVRFSDECVITVDKICAIDVATLGWCMSWAGYLRPEVAIRSATHPAFGLASWLVHLPYQPTLMLPEQWRAEVEMWLQHDLLATWIAWCRIAEFMHSQGAYFLHPALVKPADFAQEHLP